MIRRLLLCAVLAFMALACVGTSTAGMAAPPRAVAYASIEMFSTEAAAQAHCPRDTVVWLNTRSGIWHERGMRWYGRTKQGAYVCRKEAATAGYRDTRNGQ